MNVSRMWESLQSALKSWNEGKEWLLNIVGSTYNLMSYAHIRVLWFVDASGVHTI